MTHQDRDISVPRTSEINFYAVLHCPIILQKNKFSDLGWFPLYKIQTVKGYISVEKLDSLIEDAL